MAKYVDITVCVLGQTEAAVECTFHEDLPEETTIWVPLSVIEDPEAIEELDKNGNATISIARWFLKKSDIPYEG